MYATRVSNYGNYQIFCAYNRPPPKEKNLFLMELVSLTSTYFGKVSKAVLTADRVNVHHHFLTEA